MPLFLGVVASWGVGPELCVLRQGLVVGEQSSLCHLVDHLTYARILRGGLTQELA